MENPTLVTGSYEKSEKLKDGTRVKVRAIRQDDKARVLEAFKNLDSESIYTRFFQHKKGLSDQELKTAVEADFARTVALVVTIGEGEHETIIGGGRYVVIEETGPARTAEVAFTVEEDFHRQGIARILLRHLTAIAVEKGLTSFVAEVLPENKGMLGLFSRCGLEMKQQRGMDAVHVTLSLPAEKS